jgi:hypothetical protein
MATSDHMESVTRVALVEHDLTPGETTPRRMRQDTTALLVGKELEEPTLPHHEGNLALIHPRQSRVGSLDGSASFDHHRPGRER